MPTDVVLLVVTGLFAVTALVAAVITVVAARRSTEGESTGLRPEPTPPAAPEPSRTAELVPIDRSRDASRTPGPRTMNGPLIVPPTGQQVVGAAMSRPQVRIAVIAHGIAYALRPESRDRILALMRREYRRRRRERLAAGRRAVRAARPASAEDWTAKPWIAEPGGGSGPWAEVGTES